MLRAESMHELELEADRLLAQVDQDEEYPFRSEVQMWRRRDGRGRSSVRYREVTLPVTGTPAPDTTPEERTVAAVGCLQLLDLAELTAEERCSLFLYAYYDFSDDQIGEVLGRHRNTVRDRRAIACKKIRGAAGVEMRRAFAA